MSNRVVPSLNTWSPCFARRSPFSRGSGVFEREIIPCTAFTPAGIAAMPTRAIASSRTSRSGIFCRIGRIRASVCAPHFGHRGRNHRARQEGHTRRPISTSTSSFVTASFTSRCIPPADPIGKRAWGGGDISRGAAFSGRPIRAPIRVGPRAFIGTPVFFAAKSSPFKAATGGRGRSPSGVRSIPSPLKRAKPWSSTTSSVPRRRWVAPSSTRGSWIVASNGTTTVVPSTRPPRRTASRNRSRAATSKSCQNRSYRGCRGTRCSRESSRARSHEGASQSAGSSPAAARSSSRYHSIENAPGTSGWLFSRNSPYGTRISPRSAIRLILGRASRAAASVASATKSPVSSTTRGPSIESHGVTAPALPGRSVLICVPTAMNSSRTIIVAGWRLSEARPFARLFP